MLPVLRPPALPFASVSSSAPLFFVFVLFDSFEGSGPEIRFFEGAGVGVPEAGGAVVRFREYEAAGVADAGGR